MPWRPGRRGTGAATDTDPGSVDVIGNVRGFVAFRRARAATQPNDATMTWGGPDENLLPDWEAFQTDDLEWYYYNAKTGESTWSTPANAQILVQAAP